jgi:hypothetical protein
VCEASSAQSYVDSANTRDKLFTKAHTGFELLTGVTSGSMNTLLGTNAYVIKHPAAATHELNFFYKRHLSNEWSYGLKLGLGFFPAPVRFKNEDHYLFEYWDKLSGKTYANYGVELEYRFTRYPNNNSMLMHTYLQAGFSFMQLNNGKTMIGDVNQYQQQKIETKYLYAAAYPLCTFFNLSIGRQHQLRDMNLFGYYLRANYSFQDVYTGVFSVNNRSNNLNSMGTFKASGNSLALGLTYTFTGMRKLTLKEQYLSQHPTASKKEIKNYLLVKMQESPGNSPYSISLFAGPTLQPESVDDPKHYLLKSYAVGFASNLAVSYHLRNSTALELGVGVATYSSFIRPNLPPLNCLVCGSGSDAFTSQQVSLSVEQKIIPKNMRRRSLFNLSAGIALGWTSNDVGKAGYGSSLFVNGNDTIISETHVNYQVSKLLPTFLLGISRPFRISPGLDFSVGYFQYFGWRTVFQSEVTYSSAALPNPSMAVYSIIGSYQYLRLGFIYRLRSSKSHEEKQKKDKTIRTHYNPSF